MLGHVFFLYSPCTLYIHFLCAPKLLYLPRLADSGSFAGHLSSIWTAQQCNMWLCCHGRLMEERTAPKMLREFVWNTIRGFLGCILMHRECKRWSRNKSIAMHKGHIYMCVCSFTSGMFPCSVCWTSSVQTCANRKADKQWPHDSYLLCALGYDEAIDPYR